MDGSWVRPWWIRSSHISVLQLRLGSLHYRSANELRRTRQLILDHSRRVFLLNPPYNESMIRQIAPQFFTTDIPNTLAYYKEKLGFECLGTWQDPPTYAIVARDQHAIHFRCAEPPTANPEKYEDELLDAYLLVEDADALYSEYAARGLEFTRHLANMPWNSREFVVKDCDGRLLA